MSFVRPVTFKADESQESPFNDPMTDARIGGVEAPAAALRLGKRTLGMGKGKKSSPRGTMKRGPRACAGRRNFTPAGAVSRPSFRLMKRRMLTLRDRYIERMCVRALQVGQYENDASQVLDTIWIHIENERGGT